MTDSERLQGLLRIEKDLKENLVEMESYTFSNPHEGNNVMVREMAAMVRLNNSNNIKMVKFQIKLIDKSIEKLTSINNKIN
tara:strand:+ start:71 stop:313 length:243 start_codon:yes stop_codon:yes gene_type:complete